MKTTIHNTHTYRLQSHLANLPGSGQLSSTSSNALTQSILNYLFNFPGLYQLPSEVFPFVGRSAVIEQVMVQFQQAVQIEKPKAFVLVISGRPGVGKSALAIYLAHQMKQHFVEAPLYINFQRSKSQPQAPAALLCGLLREWGVATIPQELVAQSQCFRELLVKKRALLVLDDVDDHSQVSPFVVMDAPCVVLVTSRQPLIGLKDVYSLHLSELSEPEALELLQKVVGMDAVHSEPEASVKLLQCCNYLPLVINLAGSVLKQRPHLSLLEYANRLAAEQTRLKSARLSYPEIQSIFNLSYQTLLPAVAHLMRLLGVLAETTFTPAMAAVLMESTVETARVAIWQLVQLKFLEPHHEERYRIPLSIASRSARTFLEPHHEKRYRIAHDMIQLTVRRQLATTETIQTRQAARLRLSRWYLDTAGIMNLALNTITRYLLSEASGGQGKPALTGIEKSLFLNALQWFETERLNLLAAVEWAYLAQEWELVLLLAENLVHFFDLHSYWTDWKQTLLLALESSRHLGDRQKEAHVLNNLGNFYLRQGLWHKAEEKYKQSLRITIALKDSVSHGQTLVNLGVLHLQQGQQEATVSLWKIALTKLPSGSPEQKMMFQWLQSIEPNLLDNISCSTE